METSAIERNPQALPSMSPAPARSCPCVRPCSPSVCWGVRLAAHLASSCAHSCACPCQPVITDLAAPMLMAEPVSQQSVAGAVRYLMRQAGAGAATVHNAVCRHDPDRLHPGQLATVAWTSWPHPFLPVSTVSNPHRHHVPARPAAGAVLLLAPDTAAFLTVFSPLVQHCQHQAGQPQVPVSAVVSVQADGCEGQLGVSPSPSGQPPGLIRPLA